MFHRLTPLHSLFACGSLALVCGCVESVVSPDSPAVVLAEDIELPPDTRIVEAAVPRRATLANLLDKHGLADESVALIEEARAVFNPRRLRVGHPYRIVFQMTLDLCP